LKILITNNTLANRAGTELYVRDLAIGLLKRGHEPIAYSTRLGEVAADIRAAGVLATDDLDTMVGRPDIIHGHHHLDTMMALLRLPLTPAIYVCHGSTPWEEAAPRFPRILRYVAVDHACRDRLLIEHAIPPDRIRVILNFVDLERFKPRAQLPPNPRRALIFSNQANEETHTGAVRLACERAGIALNVVGKAVGNVCAEPELLLGNYDIVFAKGRAALEALAVGAAVVLCDAAGAGPMVTSQNVAELRPLNFGIRALRESLTPQVIAREIARYDPVDAVDVSRFIRGTAGREVAIDELLSLYQEVINEHTSLPNHDVSAEHRAVADYLRELTPRLRAAEMLTAKEKQLDMMRNSRSWRLISRYSAVKQKLLLPARQLLKKPSSRPGTNGRNFTNREIETRSAQHVFSEIHRRRGWGGGESASGPGSSLERADAFKDELLCLLKEIKATSLLDAGCGDFNWMKELELDFARYIGIDVVWELIAENQKTYGKGLRMFDCLDMTKDELPKVDVILCRDSLVHLSLDDILAALENFRQSGSIYLLTTTFTRLPANIDIPTGEWRPINLQMAPFNFPEPLRLIDEKCMHSAGVFADKYLGLWALKDLSRC
jgi:glycosyltransferase involved in cell wall biosynthesis